MYFLKEGFFHVCFWKVVTCCCGKINNIQTLYDLKKKWSYVVFRYFSSPTSHWQCIWSRVIWAVVVIKSFNCVNVVHTNVSYKNRKPQLVATTDSTMEDFVGWTNVILWLLHCHHHLPPLYSSNFKNNQQVAPTLWLLFPIVSFQQGTCEHVPLTFIVSVSRLSSCLNPDVRTEELMSVSLEIIVCSQ